MNKQFFIFTDGSAIGNPGPAGWAAVVIVGSKRQEIAGSVPQATVSEMELRAAAEALYLTPAGARIELRSDSKLLIHGMRFRVFRWRRFGWRNSRGFELQNQEL
jgi:ribonuclease HI